MLHPFRNNPIFNFLFHMHDEIGKDYSIDDMGTTLETITEKQILEYLEPLIYFKIVTKKHITTNYDTYHFDSEQLMLFLGNIPYFNLIEPFNKTPGFKLEMGKISND